MTIPPAPGEPQPVVTFDVRPLTDPVDPRAVRAFAAEMRARRTWKPSAGSVLGIVAGIVAAIVCVPILLLTVLGVAMQGFPSNAVVPSVLIVVALASTGAVALAGWRRSRVKRYRLARFAAANGMTYEDRVDDPPLPGMIFHLGSSRQARELVRGHTPRFLEFGNYRYTVKSGKSSTTYRWGYVAVKLDVPLPNIVLDAVGNNSFLGSNLPASFRKDQRLSLEGDFDAHFALYCPRGYERDALYLFTPDIMARFIDNAAQLDVEIVDDWLFLYTRREVSTLDPATWAWLFSTVAALMTKFDQWARWRDERLVAEHGGDAAAAPGAPQALPFAAPAGMLTPPPGVAQEGRRLRRGMQWLPIVIVILVAAALFWMR